MTMSMMQHGSQLMKQPSIEIIEQPQSRVRFRYVTEGDKAGNIYGISNTGHHQTFPTVLLRNFEGYRVEVVMSCVTATPPVHQSHPHRLVGQDCSDGVSKIRIELVQQPETIVQFSRVGVQCCKRSEEDIESSLKNRYEFARTPFGGVAGDLMICRLSRSYGSVRGGDELFLLCSSVKKDVEVVFESSDGLWSTKAEFSPSDIHRQIAIVLKTPPFHTVNISNPVPVYIYLKSPALDERSEPKTFQYVPDNPDPYHIEAKRMKKANGLTDFFQDFNLPPTGDFSLRNTELQQLLQPSAACVFTPAATYTPSLATHTAPMRHPAAQQRMQWPTNYLPQNFERPPVFLPPVPNKFETPQAAVPSNMLIQQPKTEPLDDVRSASAVNVLPVSAADSVSNIDTKPPSFAADVTLSLSDFGLDEMLISWVSDFVKNPQLMDSLCDLNGLNNSATEAPDNVAVLDNNTAAAAAAVCSASPVQVIQSERLPSNDADITGVMSVMNELQQLNELGKLK